MGKRKNVLKWLILVVTFVLIVVGLYFCIFQNRKEKQQNYVKRKNFIHEKIEQLINEIGTDEKEKASEADSSIPEENNVDSNSQQTISNEDPMNENQQATTNESTANNNQQTTTNEPAINNNQQTTTNEPTINNNQQITNSEPSVNKPTEVYTVDNDIPLDSTMRKDAKTLEECLTKGNEIKSRYENAECMNGCRVICKNIYGKYTGQIIGYQLEIRIQAGIGTKLNF